MVRYKSSDDVFNLKGGIMEDKSITKLIVGGVVAIVGIFLFIMLNPVVSIGTGQRGVVTNFGKVTTQTLDEGIHWVTPIVYDVEKMEVTIQKYHTKADASSKDLQQVSTEITLNYQLNPLGVNTIYQQYRLNYKQILIDSALREFLKATTAKFTAEELITKREMVKAEFKHSLEETLSRSNIIVKDIFITDFNFSPEFNKAIELKVQAEQEALTEKNNLVKIRYQAEQTVTTAKAEAEKIRIAAQAINAQGGKDYVQLKAIEKWNGVLPNQMIPGSTVPFISLKN
jgi:regulator of protease activity HflC (stomatin/prohibitin superfamily)